VLVAAVVLLIPSHGPPSGTPARNEGPAQLAAPEAAHLTGADRRAIDRTLDAFIPAGMERRDMSAAWALAGPELRASSTLVDWRAGTSPIPYYRPRETTFHNWQTVDVGPRYVTFNLLLHARRRRLGDYVFSGQMVKRHDRWLVNRLYTIAIMKPPNRHGPQEVGPADFGAPHRSGPSEPSKPSLLHRIGLVPAVALFVLILLVPVSLGALALLRARRWRRRVRAGGRTALPPLPYGYLPRPEEQRHETTKTSRP
jgi:hypothetical protein